MLRYVYSVPESSEVCGSCRHIAVENVSPLSSWKVFFDFSSEWKELVYLAGFSFRPEIVRRLAGAMLLFVWWKRRSGQILKIGGVLRLILRHKKAY